MSGTDFVNTVRPSSDKRVEPTSTFLVDKSVAVAVEGAPDSDPLSLLSRPHPPQETAAPPSTSSSPFKSHSEKLIALVTHESSGELFDKTQVVRMLDYYGGIDRNLGAINVRTFANELVRYSECTKDEAIKFCADLLTHYGIRSVVLNIAEHKDIAFMKAFPAQPTALFVNITSATMLSAKSGAQSDVVLGIIDANINLSELKSFSLAANEHFDRSPDYIKAALLFNKLSEATHLKELALSKCDITGAAGSPILSKLEHLELKNGKCTVEDLRPSVGAKIVDLTGTDIGESRTLFGHVARSKLGEALGALFTSELSRLSEITLPPLVFNTNIAFLEKLKGGGANPKKIELQTVNLSGAPESGNQREVLLTREKHFPHLPSPNNDSYEKIVRWLKKK